MEKSVPLFFNPINIKLDKKSRTEIKNKLAQLDQITAQNIKRFKEAQHDWEDEFELSDGGESA